MAHELAKKGQPHSINIWLDSLRSTAATAAAMPEIERTAWTQKNDAILVLLGKLSVNYWRPDHSPSQARELYSQYLEDLRPYAFSDICEAMRKYRQDPENKFFPLSGQIRGLIEAVPSWDVTSRGKHLAERLAAARAELDGMIAALQIADTSRKVIALPAPGDAT